MKKTYKKLTAALMALAMTLSLSVTALATTPQAHELGGAGVNDATNAVDTEGPLPDDVTDVVLPTSSTGQFKMIFDSHRLIKETNALRFNGTNDGRNVTDVDESRFFFQVYTNTIIDAKDRTGANANKPVAFKLVHDDGTGEGAIKAGTEVVQFAKATLKKLYATGTGTTDFKWVKLTSDGTDVEDAVAADFTNIAALENLDPTSGYGLDAIAKLNNPDRATANPNLYIRKTGDAYVDAADVSGKTTLTTNATKLVGAIEYEYATLDIANNPAYIRFVDGTATKFYSTLGDASTAPTPLSNATASGMSGFTDIGSGKTVENAKLTVGSGASAVVYYRVREIKPLLSLKATSAPVKVINKTNADIAVEMSATLTGIKGGDGKKSGEGAAAVQTYVYAKDYDAATGKFYDDVATATTRNAIQGGNDGVPVFYFALTNGTDTEVMTYDSENNKSTVSLGAMVPGQHDFFVKGYDKVNSKYFYTLADNSKREADFTSMTLNFVGAIDSDNDAWDELSGTPNIAVTWKIKSIEDLAAPTITKPAAVSMKSATTFQITNTTDKLVLTGIKQGNTEIATDSLTITTADDTGTTAVTVAKGVITGTQDLVFTFKHPTETYRTKEVTVLYAA